MRAGLTALAIVLALAGAADRALATVLFERAPADPFQAGTLFSDVQHPREAASPFTLSAHAGIASLVWWGGYFSFDETPNPGTSPFEIRFFADTGAGPEETPFLVAPVTATVSDFPASLPQFQYAATLPAEVVLDAGLWWIAIVDVDPALPTFAWRKSGEADVSYSRLPGGEWSDTPGLTSLRLEGHNLPEPGTALLAGLGLVVLGARSRRARR